jgi:hypothetical protein
VASCPLCEARKGRRACPAKGAAICAHCCGTKRHVLIDCPNDCAYLAGGDPGWARETTLRRDALRVMQMTEGLGEGQTRLLFLALLGIVGLRARHHGMDDALFASALEAFRKTVETRANGLVYEHAPGDARAAALARDFGALFQAEAASGRQAVPADRDLLAVLRGLERGQAIGDDVSPCSFLDTVVRLVGRHQPGPGPGAGASRIIA